MSVVMEVITEMVEQAAKEIGYPVEQGNVDTVLLDLADQYEIVINPDAPVTWQLMNLVVEVVCEWQKATKENLM